MSSANPTERSTTSFLIPQLREAVTAGQPRGQRCTRMMDRDGFSILTVGVDSGVCGASFADRCSELSGAVAIPRVLTLPNGMTDTFTYDQGSPTHPYYLHPLAVTLRTGGTISWGWGAPQDESGPVVSSRQLLGDPNPYSYTVCPGKKVPGATATGKATDPAGNDTVITCSYFLPQSPPRLADFGIAYITNQHYYPRSTTSAHLIHT